MIIIIDGSDNVGKSFLIKEINKILNYKVIHNSKYQNRDIAIYNYLLQIKNNRDVIIDRSILSEIVYGRHMRNLIPDDKVINNLKYILNNKNVKMFVITVNFNNEDNFFKKYNDGITRIYDDIIINRLFINISNQFNITMLNAHDIRNKSIILNTVKQNA